MAATNSLPPWVTMYRNVDLSGLSVEKAQEWGEVRCPRRKAYGCGEHGQKLVEGLTLLARFVDPPNLTTYLRIRLNDQAVQIIQAEFGMGDKPLVKIGGKGGLRATGCVHHAGDGLVVVALFFSIGYYDDHIYHLVYDARAPGSLSMTRNVPKYCLSSLTPTTLPVRREDGVHLLLLARVVRPEFEEQGLLPKDVVLCSCPPSSSCSSTANSASIVGPWQLQKQRFLGQEPKPLSRHVAFSFEGQAFWVDLTHGVVCCSFVGHGRSQAHFDFIPLPKEFQLDSGTLEVNHHPASPTMEIPVTMVRTMGHFEGSLMFVSIGHSGRPRDRMVTVLTHHLDHSRRHLGWCKAFEFSVSSLWNLDAFRRANLPRMDPECPVLTPDGALCFLIPCKVKINKDGSINDDHVCILDMYFMRILSVGHARNYRADGPIFVPRSFFESLNPLTAPSNTADPLVPPKRNIPSKTNFPSKTDLWSTAL
ncbi:hypothetical protein QOZ80_3AG0207930 [Eleusine coracana subsp. coracana]|nr:hypothetical protein QOZ80_3AG0207930 [Eleusine coracana subsp. coracana]